MLDDRDYMRRPRPSIWDGLRRVNALHVIVLLNVLVFVAQYGFERQGEKVPGSDGELIFQPWGGLSVRSLAEGRVWTVFTYMFVHADLMHVGLNMLLIWFVGRRTLALVGSRHFLHIYFLSGLVGAAAELVVRTYLGSHADTYLIGASACAMGLLFALAVIMPREEVTLMLYFIVPLRMRLRTLAMGLLIADSVLGVLSLSTQSTGDWAHVAYFAHIGGAITGWYYMRLLGYGGSPMTYERLWRPAPSQRRPELARARRRKLAVDLDIDTSAVKPTDPATDLMREEVDPILDKISEQGMSSLTADERRILERASNEIKFRKGVRHGDVDNA